jgi:dipeptidyl aminopeptidase/acylaminoacyl peptidase
MKFNRASYRATCACSFLLIIGVFSTTFSTTAGAQEDLTRRPLEHKDYDVWNRLGATTLSRDGKWAMFNIQNGAIDGESTLTIRNMKSGKEFVVPRGSGARFTHDSRFAVYRITPEKKKLKRLRKEKAKPDAMPKPRFQMLELESGELTTLERVKSFSLPEENGDWVACLLEDSTDADKLNENKSKTNETYEVTPEGLRRPKQPLKLKKREQLNSEGPEETEEESSEEGTEKSKAKKKQSSNKKENAKENTEQESDSKDKKDDEKKEKDSGTPLMLISLDTGVQRTFPDVVNFEFSKNGKVFAFTTSVELADDDSGDNKKPNDQTDSKKADAKKNDVEETEEQPVDGVYLIQLETLKLTRIASGTGEFKNLAFNETGTQLAFLTNKDDYQTKTSTWAVYLWKKRWKESKKIAIEGDAGIPDQWWVAPKSQQQFSEDSKRLYFETAPVPELVIKEREDEAAGKDVSEDEDDDKAKLDIWHWQDPELQPQQLIRAEAERNRDYLASYNLKSRKIVQLASLQVPDIRIDMRRKSPIAVANSNMPYRKMMSWDLPGFQDAFLVNLDTGKREKVLERVKWSARLSSEGNFITWFDAEKRKWYAKSTNDINGKPVEISKGIKFPLQNELHDTPSLPRAYGSAGWTTDDEYFLIYDRYDIWKLSPTGKEKPVCLTNGFGRENEISFRYRRLDSKERAIDLENALILTAFNNLTKASGFYSLDQNDNEGNTDKKTSTKSAKTSKKRSKKKSKKKTSTTAVLKQLIMLDENVSGLSKAEESGEVVFTRSTFRMFGDLWASDLDFKKIHRLSDANPQQENYAWGTAELVHWDATDGQKLDGILYKPDGFDPDEKYPMMVYFYERNSDNLHRYYVPEAGRSIINHSFYVSRGYLVFVPDIPYKTGEPGPSAANAILPGVQSLIDLGFVDEKKVGMQGHSWGGYQTAYLVTQTNMFACAESGAPVSNMTSAYGGIRWSSGMSRMFQYERTQSRIGEDLWSASDKYIANSPVFFADKIETPLLILHNDEDGAVPWYQGIELFVALRRLEKEAWMLNYNGNPHWVMGDYNRRDFAVRMQQFFDHYLMDAPEPEWMAVGVPAVNKGKEFGLELLEPEAEAEPEAEE